MPERLEAIVNISPVVNMIADIGCDHGKAAIWLLAAGKAGKAICSDISRKSLEKAKALACSKRLEEHISFRVGNGLGVLKKHEADAAIIAGMGGELITRILDEGKENAPDILVLSCNTKAGILRLWLCKNGYEITDEDLVAEGRRFYPVILARKGSPAQLSYLELEFGPVILSKKPEELIRLIDKRIENVKGYINSIEQDGSEQAGGKYKELKEKLNRYEELRHACSAK